MKIVLHGYSPQEILRGLERDGIENGNHKLKWYDSNIKQILTNEKYKGDALLQKTYTVDFLSKTRAKNDGQVQQFYVEDSHEAIIEKDTWECVQLEFERRKRYLEAHSIRQYISSSDKAFSGRVICGKCGKAYGRKVWDFYSEKGPRYVWQCSERYKEKGVVGCNATHVDDEKIKQAFVEAYNSMIENKDVFIEKWKHELTGDDILKRYRAKDFISLIDKGVVLTEFDADMVFRVLSHITVLEQGNLVVTFLDGTEIEWDVE